MDNVDTPYMMRHVMILMINYPYHKQPHKFHLGDLPETSTLSIRYSTEEYVLLIKEREPECYAKAMEDEHKAEWFDAMQDEI